MFTSIAFWIELSISSFRYNFIITIFFIWALLNQFTNKSIFILEFVTKLSSLVTLASALIAVILIAIKKGQYNFNRTSPLKLLLVNLFSLLLLLIVILLSTVLRSITL